MKNNNPNMKIYGVLGILLILLCMFIYNNQRIYGNYDFNFFSKDISTNLVPFKNFKYLIETLGDSVATKTVYFAIIGILLKLTLPNFHLNKIHHFLLLSLLIIVLTELLVVISSGFQPIPLDVNNMICYFVGIWVGYYFTIITKKLWNFLINHMAVTKK